MKIIVYNNDIISLSKRQNGLRKRGNNKQNVSYVLSCEASASAKLEKQPQQGYDQCLKVTRIIKIYNTLCIIRYLDKHKSVNYFFLVSGAFYKSTQSLEYKYQLKNKPNNGSLWNI